MLSSRSRTKSSLTLTRAWCGTETFTFKKQSSGFRPAQPDYLQPAAIAAAAQQQQPQVQVMQQQEQQQPVIQQQQQQQQQPVVVQQQAHAAPAAPAANAMMQELQAMNVGQLRARAIEAGVSDAAIEVAR